MDAIKYQIIKPGDEPLIRLIADWYLTEWNITTETTIQRISNFPLNGFPFQVLMTVDDLPVATGGIYNRVALIDREPRFEIYKPWLALMYTKTESRNKGYGKLLCEKIQAIAKEMGLEEIFLFTHTAESLYKRIGWQQIERIALNDKEIVVMNMLL